LHGQRRIGKSSILAQIPNKVATDQFYFVNFDLQGYIHKPFSNIIYNLAQEICDHLVDDFDLGQDYLTPPSKQDLNNDINIFFDKFLPKVFWLLKSKNLVFLLDEFDVLTNQKPRSEERNFFPYLANLIKRHHQLFMIAVVGRNLVDVPIIVRVFGSPPYHEIGFLNKLSAQRLITKPAKDVVTYEPHAVTKIYNLSAGHPYFTQVLCFTLFLRARENQWKIYSRDVELIVKQAIEKAEAGLAGLWESLPIPERVVFLAVAEAQQRAISQHQLLPEHPLSFLEGYGVIQTNPLYQATKRLKDYGFVDDTERRVKVPLVRHWLLQHHSLRQEILKLKTLDQDQTDPIYQLATRQYQQRQIHKALVLYEEVLQINPSLLCTGLTW
ncbi:MAG: ATP-binding protein, partial [Moorea sp. SIO3E2]|nr:ATP-binding protein [Moorena sp. SIO3E2]